jgi:hypothetical protein
MHSRPNIQVMIRTRGQEPKKESPRSGETKPREASRTGVPRLWEGKGVDAGGSGRVIAKDRGHWRTVDTVRHCSPPKIQMGRHYRRDLEIWSCWQDRSCGDERKTRRCAAARVATGCPASIPKIAIGAWPSRRPPNSGPGEQDSHHRSITFIDRVSLSDP